MFARNRRGITLIELLIVAVLLGIIFIPLSITLNKFMKGWWTGKTKLLLQQDGRDASYFILNDMKQSNRRSLGNLLPNGSFESGSAGTADKWATAWDNASSSATIVSSSALSGIRCLQFGITNGLATDTTQFISEAFMLRGHPLSLPKYLISYAARSQYTSAFPGSGTEASLRFTLEKQLPGGGWSGFATNATSIKNLSAPFESTYTWLVGGFITPTVNKDENVRMVIEYHTDNTAAPMETMWVDNVCLIPLRAVLYDPDPDLITVEMSTSAKVPAGYTFEVPAKSTSVTASWGTYENARYRIQQYTEYLKKGKPGKVRASLYRERVSDNQAIGYNPIATGINKFVIVMDGPQDASAAGLLTVGYNAARRIELELSRETQKGNPQSFYFLEKVYPLSE